MVTTIKVREQTKRRLDRFREHPAESYDLVLNKLASIAETAAEEPELSTQAVQAIRQARERLRKGQYVTDAELRKRLGIDDADTEGR